jgi:uracil-DNA glycosylase
MDRLPGWTPQALAGVAARIQRVSAGRPCAPADPFRALRLVAPHDVRVILVGQDPYPTPGQADGLSFSAETWAPRPSLRRVAEVLQADRPGWQRPLSGRLDAWAQQGVLLLNTALTVEVDRAGSHLDVGWQALTMQLVQTVRAIQDDWVGFAWGRHAEAFFDTALAAAAGGTAAPDPSSGRKAPTILRTRHPANDYQRGFMAEGSHFAATADRIDWWCVGTPH